MPPLEIQPEGEGDCSPRKKPRVSVSEQRGLANIKQGRRTSTEKQSMSFEIAASRMIVSHAHAWSLPLAVCAHGQHNICRQGERLTHLVDDGHPCGVMQDGAQHGALVRVCWSEERTKGRQGKRLSCFETMSNEIEAAASAAEAAKAAAAAAEATLCPDTRPKPFSCTMTRRHGLAHKSDSLHARMVDLCAHH